MQNFIVYVSAGDTHGIVRDYANAKNDSPPALTIGVAATLKFRLFSGLDTTETVPLSSLSDVTAWQWVMDSDYDSSTTCKIEADNASISASTVSETINGETRNITQIDVPISQMLTTQLSDYLGAEKEKNLIGELTGYNSSGSTIFVLQIERLTVRNRLSATGNPDPVSSEYITEAQIRAQYMTETETRTLISEQSFDALKGYVKVTGCATSAFNGIYTLGTDFKYKNANGCYLYYDVSNSCWCLMNSSRLAKGRFYFTRSASNKNPVSGVYKASGTDFATVLFVPHFLLTAETF